MDTATSVVCVALHDGRRLIAGEAIEAQRAHAELLAPMISRIIANQALTHVVVGVGPGPFTGLRVGITTGAVLAHALDLPVMGVCSLDAIAAGRSGTVITDAKRREVYAATYVNGVRIGEPVVGKRDELHLQEPVMENALTAEGLGRIAALTVVNNSGLSLSPMYLRKPDAIEPTTRKSVLGHD